MALFFLKRLQFSGVPTRIVKKGKIKKEGNARRLMILRLRLMKNENPQEKLPEKQQESFRVKMVDLTIGLEGGMMFHRCRCCLGK